VYYAFRMPRLEAVRTRARSAQERTAPGPSNTTPLVFQMAEVAVPQRRFAAILEGIDRLQLVPGTG
jgi:hypothetical protein